MLWKLCKSFLGKSSSKDLPKVFIGRMPADMTHAAIKTELEFEVKQHGLRNLGKTIEQEQVALKKLLLEKQEAEQKVQEVCLNPLLKRFEQGYDIKGLTWQLNQERLHKILPTEELMEREEKIDWIRTRYALFKSMEKSPKVDSKYMGLFIHSTP
ncbi:hypothetical protein [Legionella waltersii]|uniref:Uncharacterized protein n=1 Tax=Legionella waltersii TaxID=66969 RepID=A0A0W1A5B6_9GAMM|nr:hypothetical protein [Legionella waltersii]KTD76533.1 hypothetical protein Lwal_2255 [Legionella waltersii]SNU93974.1 Uncharacterised protein [Legionella waltersii]